MSFREDRGRAGIPAGMVGLGALLHLETEGMAYGVHAVARHHGKVWFVRGAAPHEAVVARVREERRRFGFADVVDIVRASPDRRIPPCSYLPRCGGCPWQHLAETAQLALKEEIVAEHLRRIGGVVPRFDPAVPSPLPLRYRSRLKLRIDDGEVGFYAGGTHELVAVETCLLADPRLDAAIPAVRALVRRLRTRVRRVELALVAPESAEVVACFQAEGDWDSEDEPVCQQSVADGTLRGIVVQGRRWRRTWGELRVRFRPDERTLLATEAGSFTQVNPKANRELVRTVLEFAAPRPGLRILELYAGAGNLTLPLVRQGAALRAVERDHRALESATRAALDHDLGGVSFVAERSERAIRAAVEAGERFDVVVLDPPRSGAAEVIEPLLQLAPETIVYVSCDPATLARDLAGLTPRYDIARARIVDLFPQTYHVETIVQARASRGEGSGRRPQGASG